MRLKFIGALILLSLSPACTPKKETSSTTEAAPAATVVETAPLATVTEYDRGKKVYRSQCIACHAFDPRKVGSSGPEVFGASKELLNARILNGTYPNGYKPKRTTKIMMKLPHLKNEIDALYTYLNSADPMK